MALQCYHPEMGEQAKPADIEASLGHYGNHYYVKSKAEIPIGQGVKFLKTLTSDDLVPQAQQKVGWHEYKMTTKAFDKLCAAQNVNYQLLLD